MAAIGAPKAISVKTLGRLRHGLQQGGCQRRRGDFDTGTEGAEIGLQKLRHIIQIDDDATGRRPIAFSRLRRRHVSPLGVQNSRSGFTGAHNMTASKPAFITPPGDGRSFMIGATSGDRENHQRTKRRRLLCHSADFPAGHVCAAACAHAGGRDCSGRRRRA